MIRKLGADCPFVKRAAFAQARACPRIANSGDFEPSPRSLSHPMGEGARRAGEGIRELEICVPLFGFFILPARGKNRTASARWSLDDRRKSDLCCACVLEETKSRTESVLSAAGHGPIQSAPPWQYFRSALLVGIVVSLILGSLLYYFSQPEL